MTGSWRGAGRMADNRIFKSPPWKVEERDGKFVVVVVETGKVVGTHDTEEEAKAQLRALYSSGEER